MYFPLSVLPMRLLDAESDSSANVHPDASDWPFLGPAKLNRSRAAPPRAIEVHPPALVYRDVALPMPHLGLERLHRLEDLLRTDAFHFGEVGLFLHRKLERATYAATPRNSLTFASTGGDGVHFGFLLLGEDAEAWPVVMTVPMCFENPNVIVGENLVDFLALGMHDAFYGLEKLAYRPAETAAAYEAATPTPDAQTLLDAIAVELSLRRWSGVAGRLAMLDARFGGRLELRDDPPSAREPFEPEAFWEGLIAKELAKPPGERNAGTIRHMRGRLAETRSARRKHSRQPPQDVDDDEGTPR